jgi:hypothetical protein
MVLYVRRGIEPAVKKKSYGKNKGDGKQTSEEVPGDLNILTRTSAAIEINDQGQGKKEDHAEENEHGINIERRIDLAQIGKEQRTNEKNGHLAEQAAAKNEFGGGGGKAADRALVCDSLGTAIKATSHEKQYKAGLGRRREFRQKIGKVLLALISCSERNSHTIAGPRARNNPARSPLRTGTRETCADPEHVLRFNEHSAGTDVARAAFSRAEPHSISRLAWYYSEARDGVLSPAWRDPPFH